MANPVKGEVPLVLEDGREFKLVLDMEALIEAEQRYGKPMHELMADAARGFMGAIAAVAGAAFLRHHPEIGRADMLAMVVSDREALTEALGKASDAAFPAPEKRSGGSAGNGGGRRGKTSGGSGAKRA